MSSYRAPEPTKEQLKNAEEKGYDPYDLLGISNIWALAPDHPLVAAAVIHDEMYLYALTKEQRTQVDSDFKRDSKILAAATDGCLDDLEARYFPDLICAVSPFIDTSIDRNTDVTRAQGIENMNGAKAHINAQARKIGVTPPYADVFL